MKSFGRIPQHIYLVSTGEPGEMIGEFHRGLQWAARCLKVLQLHYTWMDTTGYKIRKYKLVEVEDNGNP